MTLPPVSERDWLSVPEVAAILGLHPRTVKRRIADNAFPVPVINFGTDKVPLYRIPKKPLERLVNGEPVVFSFAGVAGSSSGASHTFRSVIGVWTACTSIVCSAAVQR